MKNKMTLIETKGKMEFYKCTLYISIKELEKRIIEVKKIFDTCPLYKNPLLIDIYNNGKKKASLYSHLNIKSVK